MKKPILMFIMIFSVSALFFSCGSSDVSEENNDDMGLATIETDEQQEVASDVSEDIIKTFLNGTTDFPGWTIVDGEGDLYYFKEGGTLEIVLNDGQSTEMYGKWSLIGNNLSVENMNYDGATETGVIKIDGETFIFGEKVFKRIN